MKELLGHNNIRTTQRYLNVDKGVVARAALDRSSSERRRAMQEEELKELLERP